MLRCIFDERIEIEEGLLVRVTNARWSTKRYGSGNMDVFKIYEDGRSLCRNLCFSKLGGYLLEDNECDEIWGEPIIKCKKFHYGFGYYAQDDEIAMVIGKYPGFRWMLEKGKNKDGYITIAKLWKFLNAWKRWPESERLINGGYEKLATSESFAKATYLKQKKMAEYLRTHSEIVNPGYGELLEIMKTGIAQWQYKMKKSYRLPQDVMDYYIRLMSKEENKCFETANSIHAFYNDYIGIVKEAGHDIKDNYWKFPSDLKKAHDKVMIEVERVKAAKLRKKNSEFVAAVKKFVKKKINVGNLEVRVPTNINEVVHQAEVLHQCLINADYTSKVCKGDCLLVFIMCNGEPLATAELDKEGKVIQFYGDEKGHDIDKMKPSDEANNALQKWIKTFKPKIRAVRSKVKEAA